MAAGLVNAATSEKLTEVDWSKNIEVCEFVANDPRVARDVVKAIKKRLVNKHLNTQMFTVMLLEMLMNNVGDQIHKQVIDTGVLALLVKIVKKKSELPVRERIFLLLDATQTALGGASGKFPQYYNAYYDLVSSGVQFRQRPVESTSNNRISLEETLAHEEPYSSPEEVSSNTPVQDPPEHSIIQKATNALEVLKEVLDAADPHNPEAAADEFTLDLVEQCSFQKQRVMHLVMSSRDEKIVSEAIDLNDQLQRILHRHDALLSKEQLLPEHRGQATSTTNGAHGADKSLPPDRPSSSINHIEYKDTDEEEEEEEPEQLFRRMRKGKAHAKPEEGEETTGSGGFQRPLIRPLSTHETAGSLDQAFALPPPPAKHFEREKFFQEKKVLDKSALGGHARGVSVNSHSAGSSRSGSLDLGN